jgi:hypothetical protein
MDRKKNWGWLAYWPASETRVETLPRSGNIPHGGTGAILERVRQNLNMLRCGKRALGQRLKTVLSGPPGIRVIDTNRSIRNKNLPQ